MARLTTGRSLWRRIRTPVAILTGAALWLVAAGPFTAEAQGFNPLNWFQQIFQPPPPRGYGYGQWPRYRPPRPHPPAEKVETKPAVPPTFFVAVMGDSLGQLLAQGLAESLSDRPEVGILRDAHEDSGLVRDDFYDWTKAAHDLIASGQKINVAVMLIGSNDHQPLRDADGSYDPGTPKWQEIYAARVEAISAMFRDAKIPLLWVGLPIMKNDRLSSEMAALNDIYRAHASKNGASFIDIWDAFGDDRGQFSSYGPDVNGQVVRLRSLDGIHFTRAGAIKLASFVAPDIRQILDAGTPQGDAALAKIETTTPAGTNAPGNAAVAPPVKPPIGPVLPLTGPALAPGGQLATPVAADAGAAQNLIEQTFAAGKPPKPKPGRADDFSWPPQQ
ncbi:MAG: SGNH/GDSL hydrolase family protein [Methylovirgula sp.]